MSALQPTTPQELAEALASADSRRQSVLPRGGGTKLHWGNPDTGRDAVELSTRGLHQVLEHASGDMTVTVQAGCTVAELQRTVAQKGQRLAIDPLWPEQATIGGILATNDSGALRLRFGSLRDLVIGITVALPDGTLASSGGKVVKNVAGYDLPKLMTGALGTLGVITQAVFRLHPLPHASKTLTLAATDAQDAQRLMLAIQASQLAHSALQFRHGARTEPEVDILLEGTEAGIAAQFQTIQQLAGAGRLWEAQVDVWRARQDLWPIGDASIARFSVLPSQIAECILQIHSLGGRSWDAVVQATGIGTVKMPGSFGALRNILEPMGGSLVMLSPSSIEAWGAVGTAFPLMRALKHQFDPNATINPGRFVGGF